MEVNILSYTNNPIEVIYRAYRICHAKDEIEIKSKEEMYSFIEKFVKMGHVSPLEHVSFTFEIKDVSRALSHQLVRHRIASYSQQSQRYVDANNFKFVFPELDYIKDQKLALSIKKDFYTIYQNSLSIYNKLKKLGVHQEDARYILPNAMTTNIIVTMNLRSFMHFYKVRSSKEAQWEIRELANKMYDEVKKVLK